MAGIREQTGLCVCLVHYIKTCTFCSCYNLITAHIPPLPSIHTAIHIVSCSDLEEVRGHPLLENSNFLNLLSKIIRYICLEPPGKLR